MADIVTFSCEYLAFNSEYEYFLVEEEDHLRDLYNFAVNHGVVPLFIYYTSGSDRIIIPLSIRNDETIVLYEKYSEDITQDNRSIIQNNENIVPYTGSPRDITQYNRSIIQNNENSIPYTGSPQDIEFNIQLITRLTRNNFDGGIVFRVGTFAKASEVFLNMKSLNYCNMSDITDIKLMSNNVGAIDFTLVTVDAEAG